MHTKHQCHPKSRSTKKINRVSKLAHCDTRSKFCANQQDKFSMSKTEIPEFSEKKKGIHTKYHLHQNIKSMLNQIPKFA